MMNKNSSTERSIWTSLVGGFISAMLILGISTFLFIAVNLGAYLVLKRPADPTPQNVFFDVLPPESASGTAILQRIFNVTTSEAALARLRSAPSFEMHPSLHFMTERVSNAHYRLGLEGIRYDAGWDDSTVETMLAANRNLVFLMGGSTMLGNGVAGNETISWYLNKLLSRDDHRALNFGSQAYDQQREIERLVYLLRAGYRPAHVVFLDGWNDITGLPRSNMRWQDRVVFHGFMANRGEIAFTPGTRLGAANHVRLFLESLPVKRLLDRERQVIRVADITVARDPYRSGFDFREADWMFTNWEAYATRNTNLLKVQMLDYYRNNLAFLESLALAFGFKLTVLFQPMGFFDESNPFVPAPLREKFGYRILFELREGVREEIRKGRLGMVDISDALESLQTDRYIDIAHYSPAASATLARLIHEVISDRAK